MQPSQNKCIAIEKCSNVSPDPNEVQPEQDRSVASALRVVPSSESTEPERGTGSRRAAIKDRAGAAGHGGLSRWVEAPQLARSLICFCPVPTQDAKAKGR